MSDTPRTSSMLALILETNGVLNSKTAPQQLVILCRELERELNAANDRIKQLEDRIDLLAACNADVARIAEERNKAFKRIRQLEEAGDGMVRWIENYGCKNEFYPAIEIWTSAKEAKP